MTALRYACCWVPDFPLSLWVQREPMMASLPLAIAATDSESSPLIMYNAPAEQGGLMPDMTVAQAHSVCPNLQVKIRDDESEKKASRELVKKFQTLSPFVEETECGLYFLNASGLRFVYDSESAFAKQIISTLRLAGLPVHIGVAASKFVAHVAARTAPVNGFALISTGEEKRFLANLPVMHLPVSNETLQSLEELGLKTIGQLTLLPINELMERFAADGTLLSQLAHGNDPAFFLPEIPRELLSKKISLSFSLFNTQTLVLYVERMLESLLHRLQQAGRCCSVCHIECRLEDKTTLSLTATLDQPAVSTTPFLRQLRQICESVELTAGVSDITVFVPESSVLILEQLTFQQRAVGAATRDTSTLMAKLAQQANLFKLELQQSHLPEQNFRLIPANAKKVKPLPLDESSLQAYTGHELSGFRLLQPPLAGDVISTGREALLFRFKQKLYKVSRKAGPWKLSGGWWSETFDRLYYEIQTTDQKQYLVYYDRVATCWFVQGIFD